MFKILLSLSLFLCNQELAYARVIEWPEAIELTQKNNFDLIAAENQYKSVLELERSGASPFLPRISANARGTHSGSQTTDTSSRNYSADLSLTQNLFSGFEDNSNWEIKKINSAQALIELNNVKARVSQELKQIYAETFFAQVNYTLAVSIFKRREENLRSVQLQYEVGREDKGSFLLSKSNTELAKLDILRAEHDSEISQENFKRYLGLISDELIVLKDNIQIEAAKAEPNFKEIVKNHDQILKAQNDESIAKYNISISKAQFVPSLDLSASYGYSGTTFFPEQNTWSAGLSLTVPLFNGLKDYSSYQSNSYKLKSSSAVLENLKMSLLKDLKLAYFSYVEAVQEESVNQTLNEATLLRGEIARRKYKNGLLSFENWDIIETDLIQNQKKSLISQRNHIIRQSLWERAQVVGVFK